MAASRTKKKVTVKAPNTSSNGGSFLGQFCSSCGGNRSSDFCRTNCQMYEAEAAAKANAAATAARKKPAAKKALASKSPKKASPVKKGKAAKASPKKVKASPKKASPAKVPPKKASPKKKVAATTSKKKAIVKKTGPAAISEQRQQLLSSHRKPIARGISAQELHNLYYADELVDFLKKQGLPCTGAKKSLIGRVLLFLTQGKSAVQAASARKKRQCVCVCVCVDLSSWELRKGPHKDAE